MWKRILAGGVLAVIVVGTVMVLMFRDIHTAHVAAVAEAVPSNAIVFVDKLDYSFFTEALQDKSQLWRDLLPSYYFRDLDDRFQQFNKDVSQIPALEKLLANKNLSFSLHLLGKSRLSVLFYIALDETVSAQQGEAGIRSMLSVDAVVRERAYEAVVLKDVSHGQDTAGRDFTFGVAQGILLIGTSSMLVEDAVRTLNAGGGLLHQPGYKKVAATAGKYVLGNLYLNYPLLEQLFYPLIRSDSHYLLSAVPQMASWGEFDIDLRDDAFILSGMTCTTDSLPGWLNIFSGQAPVRLEAASMVPSYAVDFLALGISDIALFKKSVREELKRRGEFRQFMLSENRIEERLGVSFFNDILDLISDEIILFTLKNTVQNTYEDVVIFEVRSRSEALERLTRWVSALAAFGGMDPEEFISSYQLDEQLSYSIYRLSETFYESVPAKFFRSHFALFDNYVIFSDSKDAISNTIYHNVLQKTLENEAYFEEVSNLMSSKANLTYYVRPEPFLLQYGQLLNQPVKSLTDSISHTLRKVPGMIAQFSSEGEMFYSNISLNYTSKVKELAHTVWESLLDTVAIMKPQMVTNHYTSEKEIMVQDAKFSLYLMNSTGRILWRLRLDGPVLSEIYQVDYYNNGKLQYLFNTASGVHLMDRNGNYVERYPVRLRSDATNGLALFDYDKQRDYRIFVACEDRRIYVYDLEGNIVPGWTFDRTEALVHKPVQHFRIGEKDYLVFSDQVRSYILNRRGQERVETKEPVVVSDQNMFYLDMNISGDRPRFVTTDPYGRVIAVNTRGETVVVMEHLAGPRHYFLMKDMDLDGMPELIFADKNQLEVLNMNGNRLFSFKIKGDISNIPDIYQFSARELKIGLTDAERNMIYLLNADGSVYEGFPLEGNTRFSIGYFAGSDSRFNLLVGSRNGFLYNYSIE
ncbi:MAG: hypothetical protein K9G38_03920 [Bacteroidales bacterium]|nr:hypothetical protein [Bacteroidales bacterium]